MKQNNNEQIVFDMFEEVATESIAEARNAYTYEEIDGCYLEAKEVADKSKDELARKNGRYIIITPTGKSEIQFCFFVVVIS